MILKRERKEETGVRKAIPCRRMPANEEEMELDNHCFEISNKLGKDYQWKLK